MKLPKWRYRFSLKCEPVWMLIFSLLVPLLGILAAVIIPAFQR